MVAVMATVYLAASKHRIFRVRFDSGMAATVKVTCSALRGGESGPVPGTSMYSPASHPSRRLSTPTTLFVT
jgi:hypothetical protein